MFAATAENKENSMSRMNRRVRCTVVFVVLIFLLFAIMILNINTGNVQIPVSRILKIIFTKAGARDEVNIIWKIRLPRIFMAAILGGALSVSGLLLQTFFSNPIAGPFVLGISNGAKMAVAFVMIVFLANYGKVSSYVLIAGAFAGALVVTGLILLVSRSIHQMSALLVAGVMIGYICSAATDFLITFASDADIVNLHNWSKGSFSGMNWSGVRLAGVVVGIAMLGTILLSKPMGAYTLGEAYAQSMGVNVKRFRVWLILLSSILSAVVTAYAGPISFVGIAVPFLVKQALGTNKQLVVIPGAFLGGAVFTMGCDLIARMAFSPTELNISTVTSVFGAPVVLFMLIRKKGRAAR